ncbi:hypothetical protein BD414DRAFT_79206 [Trametes punicea]|nr:hypothetical protein BD414DRAFT_79206 [Trametes punicea]
MVARRKRGGSRCAGRRSCGQSHRHRGARLCPPGSADGANPDAHSVTPVPYMEAASHKAPLLYSLDHPLVLNPALSSSTPPSSTPHTARFCYPSPPTSPLLVLQLTPFAPASRPSRLSNSAVLVQAHPRPIRQRLKAVNGVHCPSSLALICSCQTLCIVHNVGPATCPASGVASASSSRNIPKPILANLRMGKVWP